MTRRAVTLVELLLALTLIGVILGIGTASLAGVGNRATLRGALVGLMGSLDAARGAAVRLGEPVTLTSDATLVTVVGSSDTSAIQRSNLAADRPLGLAGLASPIRFGPAGIAIGVSNRTLRLAAHQDTLKVILSRLGRIRQSR